jgi:peptidoglycan hydrolase-like protein with peptidoglycan-binding domain
MGADFVALPPGQTIGRYTVLGVLGHGGFGITYRARDTQLGREVAIKEYLPPALAVRQDGATVLPRSPREADDFTWGRTRFVEEGRTLAGLQKSPAIVRVYDFLEVNGTAYIVMELVHGETLEQRLKRTGPLSPAAIDRLLWPLLDGLTRVHATGFLHRDIKPANILLDAEGDPTLIDFGASRAAMADRTSAMTAVFTPGYAAAEQVTSARQGPWTDIYALSATLYHAITGRTPPNVFDRMVEDRFLPLTDLQPLGFRRGLLLGLDAGLAVKVGDRPQTIPGWRVLLGQTAARDDDVTVVSNPFRPTMGAPPVIEAVPRQRRSGGWGRGLAAAVALMLATGGYFAWTTPDGDRLAAETQRASLDPQATAPKMQVAAVEPRVEPDERKAAEAAEGALRLGLAERQKVQIALTASGFDTRGSDGTFGPRSREMIAAWQKAQNQPVTGFLTAPQFQVLQRKADDERKKGEDEVRARAAAGTPAVSVTPPAPAPYDGLYGGFFTPSGAVAFQASPAYSISLRVANGTGNGTMISPSCGAMPLSVRISSSGAITGDAQGVDASCSRFPLAIQGQAASGQLRLIFGGAVGSGSANLVLGVPPSPSRPAVAAPSVTSVEGRPNGSYSGSLSAVDPGGLSRVLAAELELAGDRLSGRISSPTCGTAPIAFAVSAGGDVSGEVRLPANATCSALALSASGRVTGDRLTLDLRGAGLRVQGTLGRRGG